MREQDKGELTLPGEPCKIQPLENWTEQEKWVWEKVCEGKVANLNEAIDKGLWFDPEKPDTYPQRKVLSPTFLETILLHEPYRSSIPHQGVRVIGAWFDAELYLSNAVLNYELWLNDCRFEAIVDFSRLKTSNLISLGGSTFTRELLLDEAQIGTQLNIARTKFKGALSMGSIEVGTHLLMTDGAEFSKNVNLFGAKIGQNLKMDGSKFNSTLNMASLKVGPGLLMQNGAEFTKEVFLSSAKVGGLISIIGSKFKSKLDMSSIQVESHLFMRSDDKGKRTEFNEVNLVSAQIGSNLEIDRSKFNGELNMGNIKIIGSLFMRYGAEFNEVILLSARVSGQLDMTGSKFNSTVDMSNLQLSSDLLMQNGAEFNDVNLINANVGGQLYMTDSKFNGTLDMNNLNVNGSLFMRNGAEFNEVILLNASIGGQLSMVESKFNGPLNMEAIQIERYLLMEHTIFEETKKGRVNDEEIIAYVKLIFAKIGVSMDLSGSFLPTLNLTGTKIHGEFSLGLGEYPVQWHKGAKLILRNAEVGAIQDLLDAWPDDLKLEGFTYSRLGGFEIQNDKSSQVVDEIPNNMADRPIEWFKQWLEKDKSYSPQPYEQLATVLRNSGHKDKANEVLFAGKQREFIETEWLSISKLWLFLQLIFVGYGYRISFALYWAIILTFIGAAVFQSTPQSDIYNMPYGISFSFDTLLPIIELEEIHDTIQFTNWQKYYFYFHKAMGYILASFLIAGLSGITKK